MFFLICALGTLLVFTLSACHCVYYYYYYCCLFIFLTSHYILSSKSAHIAKPQKHTRLELEKKKSLRPFFQPPPPTYTLHKWGKWTLGELTCIILYSLSLIELGLKNKSPEPEDIGFSLYSRRSQLFS